MTRYVIAGNGAAGVSAAEALRQLDPQGAITIITAEPSLMYSRPGLAYVITGEVAPQQIIARRQAWYERLDIKLLHSPAQSLDVAGKRLTLANGKTILYDKLLIATGSKAIPPPMSNANLKGVVYLDSLEGTKQLMRLARRARRAAVIGGGITAIELVEGLTTMGVKTDYLVRRDRLWGGIFNQKEADLLAEKMIEHGVKIHYRSEVEEIIKGGWRKNKVGGVLLKSGEKLRCNLLGVAIGVRPQLAWLAETPIEIDRGILVDEQLQSSVPDIFAAGDVAQVYDRWTKRHLLDVLWPSAVAEGKAAAYNMAGMNRPYQKGIPFNVCKFFGLHLTIIGQIAPSAEGEEVQHLSRGSSQLWFRRPQSHVSAWAEGGDGSLRLSLQQDKLVGAMLIGEQRLADPLRYIIEEGISVAHLDDALKSGGEPLRAAVLEMWKRRQKVGKPI